MATRITKGETVATVEALPDDATIGDALERLHFLAKVERGLQEADRDEGISHDEMKHRFLKRRSFAQRLWR